MPNDHIRAWDQKQRLMGRRTLDEITVHPRLPHRASALEPGDRVRIIGQTRPVSSASQIGDLGTVVQVRVAAYAFPVEVRLDQPRYEGSAFGDLAYFRIRDLERVDP